MNTASDIASFKVKRTIFTKTLRQLNTFLPNQKGRHRAPCELTIIKDHIRLNVPVSTLAVHLKTFGVAKAIFDLFAIINIVNTLNERELTITVSKNRVSINTFNLRVMTTLFEDDSILRSVVLPVNYSDIDSLSINESNLYTVEELKCNKLWVLLNQAESRLRNRVNATKRELSYYGTTKEEVEQLVNQKVRIQIKATCKSNNLQQIIQAKPLGPAVPNYIN